MSIPIVMHTHDGSVRYVEQPWRNRLRQRQCPASYAQRLLVRSQQLAHRQYRNRCKRMLVNGTPLWRVPSLYRAIQQRDIVAYTHATASYRFGHIINDLTIHPITPLLNTHWVAPLLPAFAVPIAAAANLPLPALA